jgi:tripartite ATP-independent transporter DctP family solute receptor
MRSSKQGNSRRDFLKAGGAIAAGTFLPLVSARGQSPKKIRYAHAAPTAHGWQTWGEQFKKLLEEKTAGKMQVQLFPNAQMGNERDTAQAVRLGTLEMGAMGVGLMQWVPEMSVTDAPFLWTNRTQCAKAIDSAFGEDLRKRALDKGFVLAGWTDLGFRCMTNNKKTITSANDLKGLKMRVPPSKAYIALMQSMGASTVAVDLSELYLALSQGVADGQDTPAVVARSNKYYEVQKYVSKTDHVLTTAYVVINPKAFDGYDADEKKAVLAACKESDAFLRARTEKDEEEVYAFLKDQKMEVTLKVDTKSFQDATASVLTNNPDLFLPELVKLARAAPTA